MPKKSKSFKPGEKVVWIRTDDFSGGPEPVIAWVCSEEFHPCVLGEMVSVSAHEKDAADGKGKYVIIKHVWHYNEFFWAACEWWLDQKKELGAIMRKQLMKGKIPKKFEMEFQGELFDGFDNL